SSTRYTAGPFARSATAMVMTGSTSRRAGYSTEYLGRGWPRLIRRKRACPDIQPLVALTAEQTGNGAICEQVARHAAEDPFADTGVTIGTADQETGSCSGRE